MAVVTVADQIALYKGRVIEAIENIRATEVVVLIELLRVMRDRGSTVFVVGNGGSQANAQHLVLHLRDVGIKAIDLMADSAYLTAQSNDYGYQGSAARLLTLLQRGSDALIVISGSGHSDNILECLGVGKGTNIGILGFGGGLALPMCQSAVVLPQAEYGPVEDAMSCILHMIAEALK